jgi:hypothetical protein
LTPLQGPDEAEILASDADGGLVVKQALGKGAIIYCASYPADAYCVENNTGFEAYLRWIAEMADCGARVDVVTPEPTLESFLYVKTGDSNGRRVVFVFFPDDREAATLRFPAGFFTAPTLLDIMTGGEHGLTNVRDTTVELALDRPSLHFAVLVESKP